MAKAQTQSKKFDLKPEGARLEEYSGPVPAPRLYAFYKEQVIPVLKAKFEYKS